MSLHTNSVESEKLAKRWHYISAFVGLTHVVIGLGMVLWHYRGAKDHEDNIRKLRSNLTIGVDLANDSDSTMFSVVDTKSMNVIGVGKTIADAQAQAKAYHDADPSVVAVVVGGEFRKNKIDTRGCV